jgi:hypothetical protein
MIFEYQNVFIDNSSEDFKKKNVCWYDMLDRCYNEENKIFIYYGAKGIKVCDRWHNETEYKIVGKRGRYLKIGFLNFLVDFKNIEFKKGDSIDRLNPEGNYDFENTRIVSVSENSKANSVYHIKNGTHHLLGGEIQRERVKNGKHNFLGGEIQRERVKNGTHNLLGKVKVFNSILKKFMKILTEEYYEDKLKNENRVFYHFNSPIAKEWKKAQMNN